MQTLVQTLEGQEQLCLSDLRMAAGGPLDMAAALNNSQSSLYTIDGGWSFSSLSSWEIFTLARNSVPSTPSFDLLSGRR